MSIFKKRWVWIGLGLVAFALALTFFYGEALRERVLRYIIYELWLWELRVESLPVGLVWMVFLIVGSVSAYVTIIDLLLHGRQRVASEEQRSPAGPVQALARKIELACHGELARWNVHRSISDIAIQWVALREGITESEARRCFREIAPELYDTLDLEFPKSVTARSWRWLSRHLNPVQKIRGLQEIAQLTKMLEHFAGEAYEGAGNRR